MASFESSVNEGRVLGEVDDRLGDIVARVVNDLLTEFFDLGSRRGRANEHAVAAALVGCFDDELREVLQDVSLIAVAPGEVGRHLIEDGLLAEIVADHVRHVGVGDLIIGYARADGVGEGHVAAADGVDKSWDAETRVLPEDLRVKEVVVDAAVDDVDLAQASRGAHVDEAIEGDEVATFDDLNAHLAGQEGVLEVGAIMGAWRQ